MFKKITSPFAQRMDDIQPFHVMDLLARAKELEAAGRSIIHMEVGEPDFITPDPIVHAGQRALQQGFTHYTAALGVTALRESIASHYAQRYQVSVAPEQVVAGSGFIAGGNCRPALAPLQEDTIEAHLGLTAGVWNSCPQEPAQPGTGEGTGAG